MKPLSYKLAAARAKIRDLVMNGNFSHAVYVRTNELAAAIRAIAGARPDDPRLPSLRAELAQLEPARAAEQAQRDAHFARLDEAKCELATIEQAMRDAQALN